MPKRKQEGPDVVDDEADSTSDLSIIDVSFDFFDPNPKVDYQAVKRLLSQLFQRDAETLHLHELTELILGQPTVGTTIKTDGIESDPLALLTVLNMQLHHQNESIKAIANYLLGVTSTADPTFHATLQSLFSQSDAHVGLVLCERLVNMPVEVVPPMYNMLADEIKWALADGEPYHFTHLIILSRVYHLSEEEESELANSASPTRSSRPQGESKHKKQRAHWQVNGEIKPAPNGIYSFHPEDDIIIKSALHSLTYPFISPLPPLVQERRARDAFGLDIRGRMMLVVGGGETLKDLGGKMAQVFT
jgi:protein BCP1